MLLEGELPECTTHLSYSCGHVNTKRDLWIRAIIERDLVMTSYMLHVRELN